MRDHALPQDVTGYRFHIIGNMTLKQFVEVAAGVVVAFFIYQTNLPAIVKWPAILLFTFAGAFAAFVPFEERPFDHWIVAFFQALYRPTQFYWKRSSKIPSAFLYQNSSAKVVVVDVDLTPARRQRAQDFLHSVSEDLGPGDALDQLEIKKVSDVMSFFTTGQIVQGLPVESVQNISLPSDQNLPQVEVALPYVDKSMSSTQRVSLPIDAEMSATQISFSPADAEPLANVASSQSSARVNIPQQGSVSVEPTTKTEEIFPTPQNNGPQTYLQNSGVNADFVAPTAQVTQNAQLPFPQKPTEPNKVVGMVLDQNNTPIPDVIVEILTEDGFSARAVKTNILGQFFITTPLNNGTYSVQAEKEGSQFVAQQLVVNGNIINPIELRSVS